jgi:hypothetical protein
LTIASTTGAVARRYRQLDLAPKLLREVLAERLVVSLHRLRVLVRDQTDPQRIGVAGTLLATTPTVAPTAHHDQRDQHDRDERVKLTNQVLSFPG